MKVDFNKDGMTINFDKVPSFIYINEEGHGVGQIYFDGIRRKGLQKVNVIAATRNEHGNPPLKYKIQYVDLEKKGAPQYISNMEEGTSLTVKLKLDITESKEMLDCIRDLLSDEMIPKEIRKKYEDRIITAIKSVTVVRGSNGKIAMLFKEGKE